MRWNSKIIVVAFILTLIALPTVSNASLSDLEWKVKVGDRINYTYLGISVHETTVTVEEEIYFIINDLTGIPLPTISEPSVTAYWPNGSLVDSPGEEILGWYTENLQIIDTIAVRVGNWTLYTELVEDYWASRELYDYVVDIEETSIVWNATITVYHIGSILYSQSAYSFTKSTGILKHSYFVRYVGGNENEFDYYLSLSRLDGQIGVEMVLVIGSAAIVGVMITIVVLKKRK